MDPQSIAARSGRSGHGMLRLLLVAGLACAGTVQASPTLYRNWSYMSIKSDAISVEIATDSETRKILDIRVIQDDKPVTMGHSVYQGIEHPLINDVQIEACATTPEGTCSILVIPFIDQGGPENEAAKELRITLHGGHAIEHAIHSTPPEA